MPCPVALVTWTSPFQVLIFLIVKTFFCSEVCSTSHVGRLVIKPVKPIKALTFNPKNMKNSLSKKKKKRHIMSLWLYDWKIIWINNCEILFFYRIIVFETLRLSDTLSHYRSKPCRSDFTLISEDAVLILMLERFLFFNGSILEAQTVKAVTYQPVII